MLVSIKHSCRASIGLNRLSFLLAVCAHTLKCLKCSILQLVGRGSWGHFFILSHILHQDVDYCAAFDLSVQQELQRGEEGQAVCPRGYDLAGVPSASSA